MHNLRIRQAEVFSKSDGALVDGIKGGDQFAIKELFRRYYGGLCRFTYRFVRSKDDVEDIVESAFEKLWLNRERLDSSKSIRAFLFKSVKNRAYDYLREKANDLVSLEAGQIETRSGSDPVKDLVDQDLAKAISEAVEALPKKCKIVFTLSRQEGLTYAEIAEVLGISERTVENQVSRAFRHLRKRLKGYIG